MKTPTYKSTRPHFVYRIFDKDDQLLYIGCTNDVEGRISMHMQISTPLAASWEIARRIDRYTSEEYPNETTAHDAERKAITEEAPLLNRQHNPLRFKKVKGKYQPVEKAVA